MNALWKCTVFLPAGAPTGTQHGHPQAADKATASGSETQSRFLRQAQTTIAPWMSRTRGPDNPTQPSLSPARSQKRHDPALGPASARPRSPDAQDCHATASWNTRCVQGQDLGEQNSNTWASRAAWRMEASHESRHKKASCDITECHGKLRRPPCNPKPATTTPSLWGVGQTRQQVHGPSHCPPHNRRKLLQTPPWLGPGVGSTRLQLPTLLLLTQPMPLAGTSQGRQRSSPGRGPQHPHGHHGPSHSPCSSRALSANPLTSSRLCRCRFFLLLLTPMCHSPLPAQPPPTRLCQTNPPTPGCPVPDGSSRTRPTVCPLVHL